MPINVSRGLRTRRTVVPRARRLPIQRPPIIAEVFEDLATESVVELIVYEDFLDLNPQVRNFPNLSPSHPIYTGEQMNNSNSTQVSLDGTINTDNVRRPNRRDIIRRYRLR